MEHQVPTTWLQHIPLLPSADEHVHITGAIVVFAVITVMSVLANRLIRGRVEDYVIPKPKLSIVTAVDLLIEGLYDLIVGVIGKHGEKHFPFIASFFIFILFSNFLGLLPHSASPSANMSTTVALAVAAFVYYNVVGVMEHGLVGYAKHFLMGLGIWGIPIAALEMVSHVIRPITLSIRLYVNLFVDHLLVGVFGDLVAWILPVPIMFLGILVCVVQATVFTILTTVYVQMASEH